MTRKRHRSHGEKPLRLTDEVREVIKRLVDLTGWSAQHAVSFLARAGWNALSGKGEKLTACRQLLSAATEHHQTELAAKKKLAATAAKLREAKRLIEQPTPPKSSR